MRSMMLLSIAALGSVLLASGCKRYDIATVDLCPSARPAASGVVKIEMDTVNLKVNPKECYIHSDTEVIWVSDKDSFETNFKQKSPAHDGAMKFKSKPAGVRNEASFKAKHLKATDPPETYDYLANSKGRDMDPAVIIDP